MDIPRQTADSLNTFARRRPERPRERLLSHGPATLSDAELVALLLRTGSRGRSAIDTAHALLEHFGSLRALLRAPVEQLQLHRGVGPSKAVLLSAAEELGRRCAGTPLRRGQSLTSPRQTEAFLSARLAHLGHEIFAALFLDNRHRVIRFEELFRGTIDAASVYPREVVKRALELNAAAIIFAHNHPSGEAEPSIADKQLTRRLRDALALVDIRILDHLVIGDSAPVSFAERGLL